MAIARRDNTLAGTAFHCVRSLSRRVFLAGLLCSSCADSRVRLGPEPLPKPTQLGRLQRRRMWEEMAVILKKQHPEWEDTVEDIAAEFEYQWYLQQQKGEQDE